MLKTRVENLWVCNLITYFLFSLITFSCIVQCQVVRKSLELPVKDYLSNPRVGKANWEGKDHIYVQRDNSDSVRNFDAFPPHTPASALVFSGLINEFLNVGSTAQTPFVSNPFVAISGRSGEQKGIFSTPKNISSGKNPLTSKASKVKLNEVNSLSRSSSITDRGDGLNDLEIKPSISMSYSLPPTTYRYIHNPHAQTQKIIPIPEDRNKLLSGDTQVPSYYEHNDAVFGYFTKFPVNKALPREGKMKKIVGEINSLAQVPTPNTLYQYQLPTIPNFFNPSPIQPPIQLNPPEFSLLPQSTDYSQQTWMPMYNKLSKNERTQSSEESSKGSYLRSDESLDYNSSSGRGEPSQKYSQEQPSKEYSQNSQENNKSDESQDYENSSGNSGIQFYRQEAKSSSERYKQSNEYNDYSRESQENPSSGESYYTSSENPSFRPVKNENHPPEEYPVKGTPINQNNPPPTLDDGNKKLPVIPPTVGIIGWKSNTDLETTWKPSNNGVSNSWKPDNTLMNMANQFIQDDVKNQANKNVITPAPSTSAPTLDNIRENDIPDEEKVKEANYNGEEDGDEDDEEEDDEEESEEEEEEEEDDEENTDDSEENPPSYESSADFPKGPVQNEPFSYENSEPYSYSSYTKLEDLPPGPPYLPPPNIKDPRSSGYVPSPSLYMKNRPQSYKNFENNGPPSWSPILPSPKSSSFEEIRDGKQYTSENGRWLLNGGPILDFSKLNDFQEWNGFNKDDDKDKFEKSESSNEYLFKRKTPNNYGKKIGKENSAGKTTGTEEIDSKDLPLEHRDEEDKKSHERESPKDFSEETVMESNEPPPSPPDFHENRERNRVSDHEVPREVPTRLGYPGGGLWAKPPPESGIDLGFVPKKVYTQTRKYNSMKHLPRDAALADASTPEEVINAPRLREVITHKKSQEVYEEEGYEDSGYDHGGYKKHKESEADIYRHDSSEHFLPPRKELSNEQSFKEHLNREHTPESIHEDTSRESSINKKIVQEFNNPSTMKNWKKGMLTGRNSKHLLSPNHSGNSNHNFELPKLNDEIFKSSKITNNNNFNKNTKLLSYTSKNNRFNYMPSPTLQHPVEGFQETSKTFQNDNISPISVSNPNTFGRVDIKLPSFDESETQYVPETKTNTHILSRRRPLYSARHSKSNIKNSGNYKSKGEQRETGHFDTSSKERKSRDLSSFGLGDPKDEYSSESYLTLPKGSLRAVERNVPRRHKHLEPTQLQSGNDSNEKKYKEIVRDSSHSQDDPEDGKKGRSLTVKVKEDELNIRHPFLPRDGASDIHVDYVQERARLQPEPIVSQRSKLNREDFAIPLFNEEPSTTTTTTHKPTPSKSITSTTEYTPEDPSQVLRRLKSNPFLSSVFPDQKNQEIMMLQEQTFQTTTTPRITTYRGKTQSTLVESVPQAESAEERLERLKSNPFLSLILNDDKKQSKSEQTEPTRGRRIRPVVVPDSEDFETASSVKHVEQLTLAQYSSPSNGLLYQHVPLRSQQRINKLAEHLNNEKENPLHILVRRSSDWKPIQSEKNRTTKLHPLVDLKKYPFYYSPTTVSLPKYSPQRYALNPKDIPVKTHGGMEFYDSRDKLVHCKEPTPPKDIVPKREKDGEWNKNPQPDKPRLDSLGDKIDCLKVKYFGEDPFDNPLFKEKEVGVPNVNPPSAEDGIGFYADIIKNIRSHPESSDQVFENVNRKIFVNFGTKSDERDFGVITKINSTQVDQLTGQSLSKNRYSSKYKNNTINKESKQEHNKEEQNIASLRTRNRYSQLKSEDEITLERLKNNIFLSHIFRSNETQKNNTFRKAGEERFNVKQLKTQSFIPSPTLLYNNSNNYNSDKNKVQSFSSYGDAKRKETNNTENPLSDHFPQYEVVENPDDYLPIRLHSPKDVTISLKSKGTSNHPRIKLTKEISRPASFNIRIVPKGSIGYLKSHPTLHIPNSKPAVRSKGNQITKPVSIPGSLSSEAIKIAKQDKEPTAAMYLSMSPEGNVVHKHVKLFIPVPSTIPFTERDVTINKGLWLNEGANDWTPLFDENRHEQKYRVKRNNENDKYLNTKDSMELKNFLLQKYKDILSKEAFDTSTESSYNQRSSEISSLRNKGTPTITRNLGGFSSRHHLPYSSRYTSKPSSSGVPASGMVKHEEPTEPPSPQNNSTKSFPNRNSKVRFPKLTLNTRISTDKDKSKVLNPSEPISIKLPTTTSTTTPPPSTTTRMYKPKVVYRKQYGRPVEKMVDMFAVLKRQSSPETSTTMETSTENDQEVTTKAIRTRMRKVNQKLLQQLEPRPITSEVFTSVRPDYVQERSDNTEYDAPGPQYPSELRGPISRMSRNTPFENQDMLLYVVNPITGLGEWKVVPMVMNSRMNSLTMSSGMNPKTHDVNFQSQNAKMSSTRSRIRQNSRPLEYSQAVNRPHSTLEVEGRSDVSMGTGTYYTTSRPETWTIKDNRGQLRHIRQKMVDENISDQRDYRILPDRGATTPRINIPVNNVPSDESPSTRRSPRIILEPHQRKYFYAKV